MRLCVSRLGSAARPSPETRRLLRKAVRFSLLRMKAGLLWEVSLVLTDDSGIRRLNRLHRGIDQPTDVLSFAFADSPGSGQPGSAETDCLLPVSARKKNAAGQVLLPAEEGRERLLGDIVISTERAEAQAQAYGHGLRREMAFLTVHGMLHLLGLDHMAEADREEMEQKQRQILALMGLAR